MSKLAVALTAIATPGEDLRLPALPINPAIVVPMDRGQPPPQPWAGGPLSPFTGHSGFLMKSPFTVGVPTLDSIRPDFRSTAAETTKSVANSLDTAGLTLPNSDAGTFLTKAALVNAEFQDGPTKKDPKLDEGDISLMETSLESRSKLCDDNIPKSDAKKKLMDTFGEAKKTLKKGDAQDIAIVYHDLSKQIKEIVDKGNFTPKTASDLERQWKGLQGTAKHFDAEFGVKKVDKKD